MNLAIITARGGSKRIPRKNIRSFHGKPIVSYSIEAALASELFDDVMVSTDDEEIARIARNCGASVPFLRSSSTSDDTATTAEVISEVLDSYASLGRRFGYACCIYPTAPFLTGTKLQSAYQLLMHEKCDSVISMVPYSFPVQRSLRKIGNSVDFSCPEYAQTRSQDLEQHYHDAGQFYWFDVEAFLINRRLFMSRTSGYILSETEVQDIDNESDWLIAELKYSLMKSRQ